jgi:hypothetical protein
MITPAAEFVRVIIPFQRLFSKPVLLSTDESFTALRIVTLFVRRWAVEVTLQEVRAHLGVKTQRQWSLAEDEQRIRSKAIARTTPVLLALFSLVTLLADRLPTKGKLL